MGNKLLNYNEKSDNDVMVFFSDARSKSNHFLLFLFLNEMDHKQDGLCNFFVGAPAERYASSSVAARRSSRNDVELKALR